jgi:hypothetical protein
MPEGKEMNTNKLRDAFEWWYTSHYTEWIPRALDNYDEYGNSETQLAWAAFQHAHKAALNSLCVAVDCIESGAAMSLMSRVGDITTVLASGFVKAGGSGFTKVSV